MQYLHSFKIISVSLMMCVCILGLFTSDVVARDTFAPIWLKEGTYIKYVDNPQEEGRTNIMFIFDVDDSQYKGTNYMTVPLREMVTYSSASLTWKCVSITDTTAKIQVTLEYVGEKLAYYGESTSDVSLGGESFQRTGEAYVDIYTRAVHNVKGDLLGTTHLWLPANPVDGQEMVIWDINSEVVTVPAEINDRTWVQTEQGPQDVFVVRDVVNCAGSEGLIMVFYDLDTGLGIGGLFDWDPILAIVGVRKGQFSFSDMNIDNSNTADTTNPLGPVRPTLNWTQYIQYAILPIVIILIVTLVIIRKRKKK